MRKLLIILYFVLDILAPLLVMMLLGDTAAGVAAILLVAVYGYLLIQSFPTDHHSIQKQFLSLVIALGSILFGVQQWATQAVAGLALALGLALCFSIIKLDKTTTSRIITLLFGLPLILVGLWWLWELKPTGSNWLVWGWVGWIYGSVSYSYSRYRTVYHFFKQYYQSVHQ